MFNTNDLAIPVAEAETGAGLGALAPRPRTEKGSFKERVARFERALVEEALEAAGGNQAEAARQLGLTYDQLRHYRRKHRLDR